MFACSLACDDSESDVIEHERSSSGWLMRVVEDEHALVTVDDLDLEITVDPVTLPKDITGVSTTEAIVQIQDPFGSALKIKVRVIVLPAGPPAE